MLRNGFYNAAGAVISMILSLLTIPLLIRLIGLQDYGLWTLVTATIGIVGLAEAGLSVSTTVFLSRDLANHDVAGASQTLTVTTGAMFVIATIVGIGLWWSAPAVVNLFPKLDQAQRSVAVQAFQLGGWVVWARLMQQIMIGILQAHRRYGMTNAITTSQAMLLTLGLVVVAWQGGRVVAMMIWQTIVTGGSLLVLAVVAWRQMFGMKLHFSFSLARGKAVASYSVMTWLVSVSGALFSQFDRVIVGAILGTNTLGIYGAITSITAKINSLSATPVQPLLPELSALLAKQNVDRLRVEQRVQQALRLNAVVAFGMGAMIFALAPLAVQIMIPGAVSSENLVAFQLAVMIYTLYSPNATGYYVLLGDDVKTCMFIQMGSAIVSLTLIAAGATRYGLLGAVAGNVGYLGIWLLNYLGMKHLRIAVRRWIAWLRLPLVWFIIMTVAITLFNSEQTLGRILLASFGSIVLGMWWLRLQQIEFHTLIQRLLSRQHSA